MTNQTSSAPLRSPRTEILRGSSDIQRGRTCTPKRFAGGFWEQIAGTVKEIGQAAINANGYLPIRNYAAALASDPSLPPKNYPAQANAIYQDVVRNRWRYVHDPFSIEMLTASPEALSRLVLALDGVGLGRGRGGGDCDCISAALAACYLNIGFPVRIVVTAPQGAQKGAWSHVFIQVFLPGHGWITADPVIWPGKTFGQTAPFSSFVVFDLHGNVLKKGTFKRRRYRKRR